MNKLNSISKKKFELVCIELKDTKEIKRINWLDAYKLVTENKAKFVSKTKWKEYLSGDVKKTPTKDIKITEEKPKKVKLKAKERRKQNKK